MVSVRFPFSGFRDIRSVQVIDRIRTWTDFFSVPDKCAQAYFILYNDDYNLDRLVFVLAQVLGAAWYILSFDRYTSCWKTRCNKEHGGVNCYLYYLDCDSPLYDARQQQWANVTNVFKLCDARKGEFKYGMFENAITKKVVSSNFNERYFYCLWWGLQQLR